MKTAWLVLLLSLGLYLATGKVSNSGDTAPARYLPWSLLAGRGFTLDAFPVLYQDDSPYRDPQDGIYAVRLVNGRWVSTYSPVPALLALPVYAPAALAGVEPSASLSAQLEKLAGAMLVALSGALVYLTLRRVTTPGLALLATVAYAAGSSSLSVSSQGLWLHAPAQLGLAATLYCLVRARDEPRWAGWAGLPMALTAVNRPLDVVALAPLGVYLVARHRDQFGRWLVAAGPVLLAQLAYNQAYLGSPWEFPIGPVLKQFGTGYGTAWRVPVVTGLGWVLLSPSRGLWVYSPIFLFSLVGWALAWRRGGDPLARWVGWSVIAFVVVVARWIGWWGGHTFGPRLLADVLPALAYLLHPLGPALARAPVRALVAGALAWSLLAHGLGAFAEDTWSADVDVNYHRDMLWSWENNQLVNPLRRVVDWLRIRAGDLSTTRRDDNQFDRSRFQVRYQAGLWPREVRAGGRLHLAVRLFNPSWAVWLTGPPELGRVRLGWHWYRAGRPAGMPEGRVNLGREVFPGETYEVRTTLAAPPEPGLYGLEVGLLSEGVGWFLDAPPLRFMVTVHSSLPPGKRARIGERESGQDIP